MSIERDKKAVHAYISGRVQGVFYRASTYEKARELGLEGWVRNLPDGRVELFCQGPSEQVDRLLEWCKVGPPAARVHAIEATTQKPKEEYVSFEVRY